MNVQRYKGLRKSVALLVAVVMILGQTIPGVEAATSDNCASFGTRYPDSKWIVSNDPGPTV